MGQKSNKGSEPKNGLFWRAKQGLNKSMYFKTKLVSCFGEKREPVERERGESKEEKKRKRKRKKMEIKQAKVWNYLDF